MDARQEELEMGVSSVVVAKEADGRLESAAVLCVVAPVVDGLSLSGKVVPSAGGQIS